MTAKGSLYSYKQFMSKVSSSALGRSTCESCSTSSFLSSSSIFAKSTAGDSGCFSSSSIFSRSSRYFDALSFLMIACLPVKETNDEPGGLLSCSSSLISGCLTGSYSY